MFTETETIQNRLKDEWGSYLEHAVVMFNGNIFIATCGVRGCVGEFGWQQDVDSTEKYLEQTARDAAISHNLEHH